MATNDPTHDHPNRNNPRAPEGFDFDRFAQFCDRGFSYGVGKVDGQVCVEAAIQICAGEGIGYQPSCVHPVIRRHAIRLNDANWSSPAARAKGMCDYGLAQLGTTHLDGRAFANRLAFLTITKLLPVVLRLVIGLNPALADACENATDLKAARSSAIDAKNGCRKIADANAANANAYAAAAAAYAANANAYAAAAAAYAYAADASAYAAADANAANAAAYAAYAANAAAYAAYAAYAANANAYAAYAAYAADRILALGAQLATQVIRELTER